MENKAYAIKFHRDGSRSVTDDSIFRRPRWSFSKSKGHSSFINVGDGSFFKRAVNTPTARKMALLWEHLTGEQFPGGKENAWIMSHGRNGFTLDVIDEKHGQTRPVLSSRFSAKFTLQNPFEALEREDFFYPDSDYSDEWENICRKWQEKGQRRADRGRGDRKGRKMTIPKNCGECPHRPKSISIHQRPWRCPLSPSKYGRGIRVDDNDTPPADCPLRRETDEQPNYERQLAGRFLTLPWRHQAAVAASMGVLTDAEWRLPDDQTFFLTLFKRAYEKGLLAKLWDETEKLHDDPATFNPFQKQPEPLDVRPAVFSPHYGDCEFSEGEQPDTVPRAVRNHGVHMSHCNQGENEGECKYGEDDICPALKDEALCDAARLNERVTITRAEYDRMRALCDAAEKYFQASQEVIKHKAAHYGGRGEGYDELWVAVMSAKTALSIVAYRYAETKGGKTDGMDD